MQMGLVGIVEYASDVEIGEDELGTMKCQFTISCEKPTPLGVGWIALYLKNNSK